MDWLFNTDWSTQAGHSVWTNPLLVNHLLADILIALCLFGLSANLLVLWRFRRINSESYGAWVALLLAVFLGLCSLSIVSHITQLVWPALRLYIVLKYTTVFFGIMICCVLPDYILRLVHTPTARRVVAEAESGSNYALQERRRADEAEARAQAYEESLSYERQIRKRTIALIQSIKDTKEAATNDTLAAALELLRQIPDSDELRSGGA